MTTNVKVGDIVKVIRMNDQNGKDTQATKCNGMSGEVYLIDGMGQIHAYLSKTDENGKKITSSLAIIPEEDEFEVIG